MPFLDLEDNDNDDHDDETPETAATLTPARALVDAILEAAGRARLNLTLARQVPAVILIATSSPDLAKLVAREITSSRATRIKTVTEVKKNGHAEVTEQMLATLSAGAHLVILSHDLNGLLPAVVRAAADLVLHLPGIDHAILRRAIARLTGQLPGPAMRRVPVASLELAGLLSALRPGSTAAQCVQRLKGARLRLHADGGGTAHSNIAEPAIEVLRAALYMTCIAFERDKAFRAKKGGGQGSRALAVNVPGGQLLVEAGGPLEQMPNVFALTRLAWLWNVNPAEFFGGLSAWHLHFEAARLLGQRYLGRVASVRDEAHWGIRALRHEIFDNLLDPETRVSRIWLRQFISDAAEWDSVPKLLEIHSVRPSAWKFRETRRRRRPPLIGDRPGTVDPTKV